jgi:hypothetical protein
MIYYLLTLSSLRIDCTPTIFAVAFAMALYSDLVFDLETVGCFFALQAIKLGAKEYRKSSSRPSVIYAASLVCI